MSNYFCSSIEMNGTVSEDSSSRKLMSSRRKGIDIDGLLGTRIGKLRNSIVEDFGRPKDSNISKRMC